MSKWLCKLRTFQSKHPNRLILKHCCVWDNHMPFFIHFKKANKMQKIVKTIFYCCIFIYFNKNGVSLKLFEKLFLMLFVWYIKNNNVSVRKMYYNNFLVFIDFSLNREFAGERLLTRFKFVYFDTLVALVLSPRKNLPARHNLFGTKGLFPFNFFFRLK